MRAIARRARLRRLRTSLLLGPVGHLLGGSLDFLAALAHYWRERARRRTAR
ncbi:MAG TPA: hypothetical protein VKU89_04830 [Solirubrobacteraceae bacterium]|nr:hypothetical protein [Solirubrobacteraceae bacterium]